MKFRYIFIPTILLTIVIAIICIYYYDIDLLSLDQVYMISVASYLLGLIVFFGIYLCVYKTAKYVVNKQYEYIDKYAVILTKYIDDYFAAHNALTKDIVKQESLETLKELKKLISILNEGDTERANTITNLLIDIKQLSTTSKNYVVITERLDNVLICLRENDVKEKNVENKE